MTPAALMLLEPAELQKVELFQSELASIVAAWTAGPLTSIADDGRLAELMIRGAAAEKELDRTRLAATEPLRKQVDAINGLFKTVTDQFKSLRERGDKLRREFRNQERARVEREQAEARRLQIEAAEREAAAVAIAQAAPTPEQRAVAMEAAEEASKDQAAAVLAEPAGITKGTRTDSGSATWREVHVLQGVYDFDLVPAEYWEHEKVEAALVSVLKAAVRAGKREIPGCSIGVEEESTLRPGR